MLFPTITFAAFFMAVWPITWAAARRPAARCVVLLVASVGFYAYWDWRYLGLLTATVLTNVTGAEAIHRTRHRPGLQRAALWVAIGAHLAVLGWCKYYGFFASNLTSALDRFASPSILPSCRWCCPSGSPSSRSRRSAT